MQKKQDQTEIKGPSQAQIKQRWNGMSSVYSMVDSGPQTFFYTLASMLKLNEASNILEIACGAGKLIPMALDLKNKQASYYATDISEEMIKISQARLEQHFKKYQSKLSFAQWVLKSKLTFSVLNGEEPITDIQAKFDRIFCNLVLMLTTDPAKMLTNLHNSAAQGCLLGLTVWGNREKNIMFNTLGKIKKESGLIPPGTRSNFFLYQEIQNLAEQCGWEVILNWEQSAMFPVLEHSKENVHPFLNDQSKGLPEQSRQQFFAKIDELINKSKEGIKFDCQLLICRKRSKV